MNWADWVIFIILVVSSLISLRRGFVKEALSLVNWVLAFVVAMTFHEQLSGLLESKIAVPSLRMIVSFGVLFAATLIVGAVVSYLIAEFVRVTGLSGTDKILGMVFGLLRGFVIVMAILIFVPGLIPIEEDPWWNQSLMIPHLMEFEGWCRSIGGAVASAVGALFN